MKAAVFVLLIVTGVIFIGGAWYALSRRVVRGERYSPYSTYRSDRLGTRRLFLFYEDAGLEPVRLKRELLMLEEEGLLFIIEPERIALPTMTGMPMGGYDMFIPQELDRIIDWVSEGNSMVLVSSEHGELHQRLGMELYSGPSGRKRYAERVQLSSLTRSLEKIQTRSESHLLPDDQAWVELFAVPDGGEDGGPLVQGAIRRVGNGTVVILTDPYVLTNRGLLNPSNLALAVRLAGLREGGRIYFDEFHHGFSDPRTIVSYIRARRLHFTLLQVVAVFALFVWRSRSRLGRPRRLEGPGERGSAEYVRAFSLIYRRANLHRSVMRSTYELFRERVAVKNGLMRKTSADEIKRVLDTRNKDAASRFASITRRAGRASPAAGGQEVLAFMRLVATFEKEFLDAGKRPRKAV